MTIAAAYLTSEGVVLGADSTTTVGTGGGVAVAQLLNYAQKIFEVGERSRLGVCTWGAGRIGEVSHRTLIARLADQVDINTTKVSDAVHAFTKIVSKEYGDGKNTGKVGYILGGWDSDTHIPECYHFVFEPSGEPNVVPLAIGEAKFFGCPEFFTRVFHGYDSKLPNNILRELKRLKFNPVEGSLEEAFAKAFKNAAAPLAAAGFGDLPIREAIDYVHTYLHITTAYFITPQNRVFRAKNGPSGRL